MQLKTRYLNSGFCTLKMKAFEQLSKVVILGATQAFKHMWNPKTKNVEEPGKSSTLKFGKRKMGDRS